MSVLNNSIRIVAVLIFWLFKNVDFAIIPVTGDDRNQVACGIKRKHNVCIMPLYLLFFKKSQMFE